MCPFQDSDRNNFEFPKAKELVIFDPNACWFFFFFADNLPNDKSKKPAYEINRSYETQDNTKAWQPSDSTVFKSMAQAVFFDACIDRISVMERQRILWHIFPKRIFLGNAGYHIALVNYIDIFPGIE